MVGILDNALFRLLSCPARCSQQTLTEAVKPPDDDASLSCAWQVNRRSDIYVFSSSFAHNVVPKDKWLAFVSTTVETSNPEAELAPGQPRSPPFSGWCGSAAWVPWGRSCSDPFPM